MYLEKNRFFMPATGWVLVEEIDEQPLKVKLIELSPRDKQILGIMVQEETTMRGPQGQPMVEGTVIMPRYCYLMSALGTVEKIPVGGIDGFLINIDHVIAWEYDDEKLKPPPGKNLNS